MSGTLRIRNWDRWQSYRKDRGQPPWIKIHREVMRNPEWVELSDAERGQLVAMWLLAADRDGVIPASPATIKKLCYLDNEPNIQVFVDKGFIEPDANMTPSRRQHDAPEEEAETEAEKSRGEGADAPDADQSSGWHGNVINLNARDYAQWKKSYSQLDLDAELVARDAYLAEQGDAARRKWFQSTSKYLANRNMEAKAKGEIARSPPAPRLSRTQQAAKKLIEEIDSRGNVVELGVSRRGICGPDSSDVPVELPATSARS